MHISKIDLNLLVVFETVYNEGSISGAARTLHLSQPAVSHALRRLRDVYADPLFIRQGKRMTATPLARQIRPDIQQGIATLQQTLSGPQAFDPGNSQKLFNLGMRDVVESAILPNLVTRFEKDAPGIRWTAAQVPRRDLETELATGGIDLAFDVLLALGPDIKQRKILDDRYVVVARKRHPLLRGGLSLEKYLSARHVTVSSRRRGATIEDFELSRLGLQRHVITRCQHYFVAWKTVAQTDLLLTVPQSLAKQHSNYHNLKQYELPVELPPLAVHMYWHKNAETDAAVQWLRRQIDQLVDEKSVKKT